MKWIEKFKESIDHFAGETVRKEVMEASGKLGSDVSPRKKSHRPSATAPPHGTSNCGRAF